MSEVARIAALKAALEVRNALTKPAEIIAQAMEFEAYLIGDNRKAPDGKQTLKLSGKGQ